MCSVVVPDAELGVCMARLQIYIPDELADALKAANVAPYRLNVSQVCREALERVISTCPTCGRDYEENPGKEAPTRQVTRTPRSKPARQGELSEMERLQDIMDRGGFKTSRGGR